MGGIDTDEAALAKTEITSVADGTVTVVAVPGAVCVTVAVDTGTLRPRYWVQKACCEDHEMSRVA